MKLSDFAVKAWAEGEYEETTEFLAERGYRRAQKFWCSIGAGISLLQYVHKDDGDRVYELVVDEAGQLIEFYDVADEWQFLLHYLPLMKNHWDGS
jgi:hypothetical protein